NVLELINEQMGAAAQRGVGHSLQCGAVRQLAENAIRCSQAAICERSLKGGPKAAQGPGEERVDPGGFSRAAQTRLANIKGKRLDELGLLPQCNKRRHRRALSRQSNTELGKLRGLLGLPLKPVKAVHGLAPQEGQRVA